MKCCLPSCSGTTSVIDSRTPEKDKDNLIGELKASTLRRLAGVPFRVRKHRCKVCRGEFLTVEVLEGVL